MITGAARGIGRAIALAFAERGAEVALGDRDAAALEEARAACEAQGARARSYVMDVTQEAQVVQTFDAVAADFGRFDVLVNNAGITRDALLVKAQDNVIHAKMSLAQFQSVIDVNLTGVFLCGREGAERMIRQGNGGLIVNISSISREGNPGQSNYSAAKAAVAAMTVALRHQECSHRAGFLLDRNPRGHEAGDDRSREGRRAAQAPRRAGGDRRDGCLHRRKRLCHGPRRRGGWRTSAVDCRSGETT